MKSNTVLATVKTAPVQQERKKDKMPERIATTAPTLQAQAIISADTYIGAYVNVETIAVAIFLFSSLDILRTSDTMENIR